MAREGERQNGCAMIASIVSAGRIMRLNGWQRIGVIASVSWFVIGGLWINSLVIADLGASATANYSACLSARSIQPDGSVPADTDWGPCSKKFAVDFPVAVADHWTYAVVYTAIPIPIVWLIVYGMVGLVRWVRAGFAYPSNRHNGSPQN